MHIKLYLNHLTISILSLYLICYIFPGCVLLVLLKVFLKINNVHWCNDKRFSNRNSKTEKLCFKPTIDSALISYENRKVMIKGLRKHQNYPARSSGSIPTVAADYERPRNLFYENDFCLLLYCIRSASTKFNLTFGL